MKFRVNSREFAKALTPAVEVATKNCEKEHPNTNNVTLKVDKDKVTAFAFAGTASLIAMISDKNYGSLNYDCSSEGVVTVNANSLNNSLTTMKPGDVDIELKSGEVIVTHTANQKDKRSMGTLEKSKTVEPPNVGTKFVHNFEIDRNVFIRGLDAVMFAPAVEEKMFTYMCMLIECIDGKDGQTVRFEAGTGGRFAFKTVEGKNLFKSSKDVKLLFPKHNLSSLHKIAKEATSEKISVKSVKHDAKNDIPEQIMVEFNGTIMCLFGLENFTKYPPLTPIVEYQYPNKIYSQLSDWAWAIKGVAMSYGEHLDKIHNTRIEFNTDDGEFLVKPKTLHNCDTTVPMSDDDDHISVVKGDDIWFACSSEYLKEFMTYGGKTGRVCISFESQAQLDDVPDDKQKQMRPVLIQYPERSDEARGVTENFYMFFSVSTK